MRRLPRLPLVLRLEPSSQEDTLTAITVDGPVPLYRFVPLQAAVLSGLHVPFAAHWPEHLRLFVYAYMPLPALKVDQLPPAWAQDFGVHVRDRTGLRPWNQATYRCWPLYLYAVDPPNLPPIGEVLNLFERVSMTQSALPPPGCSSQGP